MDPVVLTIESGFGRSRKEMKEFGEHENGEHLCLWHVGSITGRVAKRLPCGHAGVVFLTAFLRNVLGPSERLFHVPTMVSDVAPNGSCFLRHSFGVILGRAFFFVGPFLQKELFACPQKIIIQLKLFLDVNPPLGPVVYMRNVMLICRLAYICVYEL